MLSLSIRKHIKESLYQDTIPTNRLYSYGSQSPINGHTQAEQMPGIIPPRNIWPLCELPNPPSVYIGIFKYVNKYTIWLYVYVTYSIPDSVSYAPSAYPVRKHLFIVHVLSAPSKIVKATPFSCILLILAQPKVRSVVLSYCFPYI